MSKELHLEQEYDMEKLTKNIKNYISQSNPRITQVDIADFIGLSQSVFNRKINGKNSFSIPELVGIQKFLKISFEELLGIESPQSKKITTFKDIIQCLFDIDNSVNLSITEYSEECHDVNMYDGYPEIVVRDVYKLSFLQDPRYNYYLNDFMKEWKEIKDYLAGKDDNLSSQIYELWKNDQLNKASQKEINTCLPFDSLDFDLPFD